MGFVVEVTAVNLHEWGYRSGYRGNWLLVTDQSVWIDWHARDALAYIINLRVEDDDWILFINAYGCGLFYCSVDPPKPILIDCNQFKNDKLCATDRFSRQRADCEKQSARTCRTYRTASRPRRLRLIAHNLITSDRTSTFCILTFSRKLFFCLTRYIHVRYFHESLVFHLKTYSIAWKPNSGLS